MKQPTFNWEAEHEYNPLKNFRLEVNIIFKLYSMPQAEQRAIIKKVARHKRPKFSESLTQIEPERCNAVEGLYYSIKQ